VASTASTFCDVTNDIESEKNTKVYNMLDKMSLKLKDIKSKLVTIKTLRNPPKKG